MVAQGTKVKEGVVLLPDQLGRFQLELLCTVGHTYPDPRDEGLRVVELEITGNGPIPTTVRVHVTNELASGLPHIPVRRQFIATVTDEGLVLSKVDLFEDRQRWVPLFPPA